MNFLSKKTNFGKLLFLLAFISSLCIPTRSVANENSACPTSGTKTKAQINTTFGGNQGACMVTPEKYELKIFELGLCETTSPIVGNAQTKTVNIEDNCVKWTKAADPRCFFHKNKLYVLNNSCTNNSLIDYNTRKHIKIKINGEVGGKNFTFISHSDKLYFIQWMKPFILYEFDIDKENATEVYSDYTETDYEYRGGTPGYKYNKYQLNNEYYGFGHRTYKKNNIVTHDIFLWVLTFNKKKPKISIIDILKPNNAKNICDPTSVIEIDNKKYLITAESEKEWFSDQDYITNVYEIVDNNNID